MTDILLQDEYRAFGGTVVPSDLEFIDSSGRHLPLSRCEMKIVGLLAGNANHTVCRETLLKSMWGTFSVTTRTIDTHVSNLRRKLGQNAKRMIKTVYGAGYKYVENALA